MPAVPVATDLREIKARQQSAWAAGDYATIGTTLQLTGELLCEAVDVVAGELVLDVATGNGNAALAAARRGAVVTASDFVGTSRPLAGLPSPFEWGEHARLHGLLDDGLSTLTVTPRMFIFRYRSARHWRDAFRIHYGPVVKAFATLDHAGRDALDAELLALARAHNTSTTGAFRVPSEYVEVVAVRDSRASTGRRARSGRR